MTSLLPTFIIATLLLCVSAKSFQAECTFNSKPESRRASKPAGHGRAGLCGGRRRAARVGSRVKGTRSSRPAFYGVKTNTVDVVIKAQAAGAVTIYLNGETYGETATSTCGSPAVMAATLKADDVVSFTVKTGTESGGGSQGNPTLTGFFAAIFAADGTKVYATAGQSGWKCMYRDGTEAGWMLPGFDDSEWYPLEGVPWESGCNIEAFSGTGAPCTWKSNTFSPIDVRFVVPASTPTPTPTPNDRCACNDGECDDGVCSNCLFDQGDGRLVCYKDWSQDSCMDAGSQYTWCGSA